MQANRTSKSEVKMRRGKISNISQRWKLTSNILEDNNEVGLARHRVLALAVDSEVVVVPKYFGAGVLAAALLLLEGVEGDRRGWSIVEGLRDNTTHRAARTRREFHSCDGLLF